MNNEFWFGLGLRLDNYDEVVIEIDVMEEWSKNNDANAGSESLDHTEVGEVADIPAKQSLGIHYRLEAKYCCV